MTLLLLESMFEALMTLWVWTVESKPGGSRENPHRLLLAGLLAASQGLSSIGKCHTTFNPETEAARVVLLCLQLWCKRE